MKETDYDRISRLLPYAKKYFEDGDPVIRKSYEYNFGNIITKYIFDMECNLIQIKQYDDITLKELDDDDDDY